MKPVEIKKENAYETMTSDMYN